jgi:hypothetical protein
MIGVGSPITHPVRRGGQRLCPRVCGARVMPRHDRGGGRASGKGTRLELARHWSAGAGRLHRVAVRAWIHPGKPSPSMCRTGTASGSTAPAASPPGAATSAVKSTSPMPASGARRPVPSAPIALGPTSCATSATSPSRAPRLRPGDEARIFGKTWCNAKLSWRTRISRPLHQLTLARWAAERAPGNAVSVHISETSASND